MKNADLVIENVIVPPIAGLEAEEAEYEVEFAGLPAGEVVVEEFDSAMAMNEWEMAAYQAYDRKYGKGACDRDSVNHLKDIFGEDFHERWFRHRSALIDEETRIRTVTVDGVSYEVEKQFPVLYSGWECDSDGFVVTADGVKRIVLTDHGVPRFADPEEVRKKIREYNDAIRQSEEALAVVGC